MNNTSTIVILHTFERGSNRQSFRLKNLRFSFACLCSCIMSSSLRWTLAACWCACVPPPPFRKARAATYPYIAAIRGQVPAPPTSARNRQNGKPFFWLFWARCFKMNSVKWLVQRKFKLKIIVFDWLKNSVCARSLDLDWALDDEGVGWRSDVGGRTRGASN